MTQQDSIEDLFNYESDRRNWLHANSGTTAKFTTAHGQKLATAAAGNAALRNHLIIPHQLQAVTLTDESRKALAHSLNTSKMPSLMMQPADIEFARSYVASLFDVDMGKVSVIVAPARIMGNGSLGTVYTCGLDEHVIVLPQTSFDPKGVAVRQFAIAAHYTRMRQKGGVASMLSNELTLAMSAQYALFTLASAMPDQVDLIQHLQNLVVWEFAKGLALNPEVPMNFITSDLGAALMQAYGGDFFKDVVQHLYDSAPNGQAMIFGSNNFNGTVLALCLLGNDQRMKAFMSADAGDIHLRDALKTAFTGMPDDDLAWLADSFTAALAGVIPATGN